MPSVINIVEEVIMRYSSHGWLEPDPYLYHALDAVCDPRHTRIVNAPWEEHLSSILKLQHLLSEVHPSAYVHVLSWVQQKIVAFAQSSLVI